MHSSDTVYFTGMRISIIREYLALIFYLSVRPVGQRLQLHPEQLCW